MIFTDTLEVREVAGKGRGVFARRGFAPGTLIERCPVIGLDEEHWEHVDRTVLEAYCFKWGKLLERPAVALGYGSLYNHSFEPNAHYVRVLALHAIDFIALREIMSGEEIKVNYNGDPFDRTEVWFAPVE